MKKQTLYLLMLCLSAPVSIDAAPSAPESLSLEQCLRIAYQTNPQMREARQQIERSEGVWLEAEALPDPEASIDIGGLKEDEGGSRKGNVGSFSIKQPLDPLGTRFLKGRMAYDDVRISKHRTVRAWTDVATHVREVYALILAEDKAIDAARDNLNANRQFLTQVENKFQSGNALKSDLIRARIENARAENEFLEVQKNLKIAKGHMNALLGRAVEEDFFPADVLEYEPLHYQYQLLADKAQMERSDLKAAETELSQKKKSLRQALLRIIFPTMSLGVERTTESYDNDTSLLLSASYPLWGFNLGDVKKAKAEKKIQEVRLEAFKRQISLEVYEAFIEAEAADKQVEIQKKSLEETHELLRQTTLQYQEGGIAFLGYLENIKTIKETRLGYFQALRNFQEKVARLEQAYGEVSAPTEGAMYEK